MCDYNLESRKAVAALPVSANQVQRFVGPRAYRPLVKAIRDGRARAGHDLYDGSPLPPGCIQNGHYMSPQHFQRALERMQGQPHRCQWCGGCLPRHLVSQHLRPHNHREVIAHHFHPSCWKARLLAIGMIFNHLQPEVVVSGDRRQRRRGKRKPARRTVERIVKQVYRLRLSKRN